MKNNVFFISAVVVVLNSLFRAYQEKLGLGLIIVRTIGPNKVTKFILILSIFLTIICILSLISNLEICVIEDIWV